MDWLLSLIPGGGLLSSAFSMFGGWEWVLGLAGGPITIAAMFLKKWKWVALAIGIAALAIWILSLYLTISHRNTTIAEIRGDLTTVTGNWNNCQAVNKHVNAEVDRIQTHHAEDLAAVTSSYERKIRAMQETVRDKGIIHEAAKECIGTAGPYRAAVERLRVRGQADPSPDGRQGDPGPATGSPLGLRPGTADAGRQPRRRGKRGLVLRCYPGGGRLPGQARRVVKKVLAAVVLALLVLLIAPRSVHSHEWYDNYKDSNKVPCCGGKDCKELPSEVVRVVSGGYLVVIPGIYEELIPYHEALPSEDNHYHICIRGGERKCFFAPPMGV